jgi:hypothetical protein
MPSKIHQLVDGNGLPFGGAAKALWDAMPAELGLDTAGEFAWWDQLNTGSATLAAHAAGMLNKRRMFE